MKWYCSVLHMYTITEYSHMQDSNSTPLLPSPPLFCAQQVINVLLLTTGTSFGSS